MKTFERCLNDYGAIRHAEEPLARAESLVPAARGAVRRAAGFLSNLEGTGAGPSKRRKVRVT